MWYPSARRWAPGQITDFLPVLVHVSLQLLHVQAVRHTREIQNRHAHGKSAFIEDLSTPAELQRKFGPSLHDEEMQPRLPASACALFKFFNSPR